MEIKSQILSDEINASGELAESELDIVLSLHCSFGDAKQWDDLATVLGNRYSLLRPEYFGSNADKKWHGEYHFSLADEVQPILNLIDNSRARVHLIGHSYGGSLALYIALIRSHRIASVILCEPCAFHVLSQLGTRERKEYEEISDLSDSIKSNISIGDSWSAMSEFVEYWIGNGAWLSLPSHQKDRLIAWAPKAALEFHALFGDKTTLNAYKNLTAPVKLLQGELSPAPMKSISNALLSVLPDATIDRLAGVGHLGPLTHAEYFANTMAAYIDMHANDRYADGVLPLVGQVCEINAA